jgi:DNA-binding NarL/FixJ family response regulator
VRVQDSPGPAAARLREPVDPVLGAPVFSAMVVAHAPDVRASLGLELARLGADPLHEAGSAGEATICAVTWGICELAVVDLDLPDGMALPLVGELRTRGWLRVVVLATAGSSDDAEAAFGLGAHGYLVKAAGGAQGRMHRSDLDGENRLRGREPSPARVLGADGLLRELSGREVQVLQLVAHGQSNKDVGERLGLSSLTVKSHLSRISRKLGTGDRAQMVTLAMRAGIID